MTTSFRPARTPYLRQLSTRKREPSDMTDRSADGDVERMQRILARCEEADFGKRLVSAVLAGEPQALPRLTKSFDLGRRGTLSPADVLSLFFYMGYLTVSPESMQQLVCPNQAVREQFFRLKARLFSAQEGCDFGFDGVLGAGR